MTEGRKLLKIDLLKVENVAFKWCSFILSVFFYLQSFSTYGHSTFSNFIPSVIPLSVVFYLQSFYFGHSTFGLFFCCFVYSTFGHSTFGHGFLATLSDRLEYPEKSWSPSAHPPGCKPRATSAGPSTFPCTPGTPWCCPLLPCCCPGSLNRCLRYKKCA
jgi:hypothetical protein